MSNAEVVHADSLSCMAGLKHPRRACDGRALAGTKDRRVQEVGYDQYHRGDKPLLLLLYRTGPCRRRTLCSAEIVEREGETRQRRLGCQRASFTWLCLLPACLQLSLTSGFSGKAGSP